MRLGGAVDPLLPAPPAEDAPPEDVRAYAIELHRRLSELFVDYASRIDNVIPYSATNGNVLVVNTNTQGHVDWGAAAGGNAKITTQDEGIQLSATVDTLNFVGAGVTATGAGATTTITIPGGGGGSTSPLTTKGDVWGYDTADNRIPVGATLNMSFLVDATTALGVKWAFPPSANSVGGFDYGKAIATTLTRLG
jgi:hypothetical protein